jgi:hypothetical protein
MMPGLSSALKAGDKSVRAMARTPRKIVLMDCNLETSF